MKSRIIEKTEVKQKFVTGDFFMTPSRNIRQIVYGVHGNYSALDIYDGRMYYNAKSLESLIKEYELDGEIKKIVPAGFDADTNEVLFAEV